MAAMNVDGSAKPRGGATGMARASLGTDRRGQYMSIKVGLQGQMTEDELDAHEQRLIERAHQRLMERGTGGLLTWQGDRLVRRPGATRRRGRGIGDTAKPPVIAAGQVTPVAASFHAVCEV